MSNEEKDTLIIESIKEAITTVDGYCGNLIDYEFYQNNMVKDAVLMQLILIGELVNKLSFEFKNRNNEVDWKQIKVARNFYVHQYGNIDWTSVWEVKQRFLPILKNYLDKIK